MESIEIISLIYKSKKYLDFIINEMEKISSDICEVKRTIVFNDASEELIEYSKTLSTTITFKYFYSPDISEYYINRVYRCYDYSVRSSVCDFVCLINSDMAFTDNWLDRLLERVSDNIVPCSRLIESGKMVPGKYGIAKNFGISPDSFDINSFKRFGETISIPECHDGGLYMPFVIRRTKYEQSGGYPFGNVFYDNGSLFKTGDEYFFHVLLEKIGMRQITVFDSLVYHMQSGERDE